MMRVQTPHAGTELISLLTPTASFLSLVSFHVKLFGKFSLNSPNILVSQKVQLTGNK